ncbi:MAG TPA: hypothetical protein VFY06_04400 [Verrucomicrobiae bacterium]|nr:hypothetical protein [Verrucomicrobiae bacterium]
MAEGGVFYFAVCGNISIAVEWKIFLHYCAVARLRGCAVARLRGSALNKQHQMFEGFSSAAPHILSKKPPPGQVKSEKNLWGELSYH